VGFTSLAEWLNWQEQLHPSSIDLGLDRVKFVALRLPFFTDSRHVKTIIVGGTNGKGSCVAYLEAILVAAGYRVGAYSSPHLMHYNERIRINGVMVDDQTLCTSFERVNEARGETSLTYFEFGTLAALDIFYQQEVDVRILEVGLGGRLDAVNIVEPDVAIVVNVAMDHEAWLGNTRELIGLEKAGIFRANIPLIIGEPDPPASVLEKASALGNNHPLLLGHDFIIKAHGDRWEFVGMAGSGQQQATGPVLPKGRLPLPSAACALQALMSLELFELAEVAAGLENAHLPGRCQQLDWRGRRVILDVAHNPAGAEYLAGWLREHQQQDLYVVFSALSDKDYAATIASIKSLAKCWYLAPLSVTRAATLENLGQCAETMGLPWCGFGTIASALEGVLQDSRPGDTLLVFGSFYTVADAIRTMVCEENGVRNE
jgi:dihydrofolate synthase/folylpolyglutamate synthase